MNLNYKTMGEGYPLVILHGLFGTLDNWQTIGKRLSEQFMVYLVDLRNHGRSPHAPEHTYRAMAEDVREFMAQQWIHEAFVMGHSMGGKVAMELAVEHPETVRKLVVVDIAPKVYKGGHEVIFETLMQVDLGVSQDRSVIESQMAQRIEEPGIRQFLMKNLSRNPESGKFEWKMNLQALWAHYADILADSIPMGYWDGPALFLRGGQSGYIQDQDWASVLDRFPQAQLVTIQGAGHWVHAEQPDALYQEVFRFLSED